MNGFTSPGGNESKSATRVKSGCVTPKKLCAAGKTDQLSVVLPVILPVKVKVNGSTITVETYAFYDSGSGGCLLTETLRATERRGNTDSATVTKHARHTMYG